MASCFQREGVWTVEGDPTEGALYPFATKLGMDRQAEQAAHPRIDAIPFESEHKFMATLHKDTSGKQFILVKDAPKSNNVAKPIRTTFRRGHGRCKEGFRWGSPWWPRV
jgi:magnesium-transporting ATPase (P-type)